MADWSPMTTSRLLLATRAEILARVAYPYWEVDSSLKSTISPSFISIRSFLPHPRYSRRSDSSRALEEAPAERSLIIATDRRVVKVWRYIMVPMVLKTPMTRITARRWNL